MYLLWLVSCSFLLSRKLLSNIICVSNSMTLMPWIFRQKEKQNKSLMISAIVLMIVNDTTCVFTDQFQKHLYLLLFLLFLALFRFINRATLKIHFAHPEIPSQTNLLIPSFVKCIHVLIATNPVLVYFCHKPLLQVLFALSASIKYYCLVNDSSYILPF